MAPRRDQDLEIFTDLHGTPDTAPAADVELLDDLEPGAGKKKPADDEDDDLEIADESGAEGDETDGQGGEAPAAESEEEDEDVDGTGEPVAQADPEILFNPADVQVIIAESTNLELRENTTKEVLERAKKDAADAKEAMAAAMEAGDTKAHVAAAEKFADAKGAFQTATAKLENIGSEKANLAARAKAIIAKAPKNDKGEAVVDKVVFKPTTNAAPAREAAPKGSKLLPKFLEQNTWFNDPKKAGLKAVLVGIDTAMAAEKKLDKNSPEWFAEMGKRFNKLHPGVYKGLDGKLIATGTRQRGAGTGIPGSGGGGGGAQQQQGGKIRLTSEDVQQMRVFNLDPDDKAVRRAWLNEKIASAKAESRRAA
jgi:hypothetical protein